MLENMLSYKKAFATGIIGDLEIIHTDAVDTLSVFLLGFIR